MPKTPTSNASQVVQVSAIPVTLSPQLFWPSVCDETYETKDFDRAPSYGSIRTRFWQNPEKEAVAKEGSPAFWNSAASVQKVFLMDIQLDEPAMLMIRDYFSKFSDAKDFPIKEIKILCGSNDKSEVKAAVDDMRTTLKKKDPRHSIELRQTLNKKKFPFLHDRFAVLDDELWHFGATVGGLHKGLNAYSRGWSASAHRFMDMFDEAWKATK